MYFLQAQVHRIGGDIGHESLHHRSHLDPLHLRGLLHLQKNRERQGKAPSQALASARPTSELNAPADNGLNAPPPSRILPCPHPHPLDPSPALSRSSSVRACTQVMDAAPRSAFLAAIVLPYERTAVMGTINVVKTCAQSLGPVITGVLGHAEPLLGRVCGRGAALKATYDLGLLAVFAEKKEVKKNRAERGEEER